MTHVPPPRGVSITYSSAIISILAMVLLSTFFKHLSLVIVTLQAQISLILFPRVGHRLPLIIFLTEPLMAVSVFHNLILILSLIKIEYSQNF